MDIKVTEKALQSFLSTKANIDEISKALSLCGPTVDRKHKIDNEIVLEIESITNRVDTSCVFGVAREANAILQQMGIDSKLTNTPQEHAPISDKNFPNTVNFQVESDQLIKRFTAITFLGCTIKESDSDTKSLLNLCDQRPINNLIDITNELTILYGFPTHIFDLDKMALQKLLIREARNGETISTLDDQKHELKNGDIVIEDGLGRIIDLCGIMGGNVCEVDQHTKNILFIAPIYNPKKIRQTSLRLQKRTLAAQIYEKSPDPELAHHIISIAASLIEKRAGGKIGSKMFDLYTQKPTNKEITVNLDWLSSFAGITIPNESILKILRNLGFQNNSIKGNILKTTPATFRAIDITIPEDVAEEIVRVFGYYQIPGYIPLINSTPEKPNPIFQLEKTIRHTLSSLGFFEVYNNSLISLEQINNFQSDPGKSLKLTNSLSTDYEYLRSSLIPSTLTNQKNNQGKTDLKKNFFEIANVYLKKDNAILPDEIPTLCISTNQDIFLLKSITESILLKLNQNNYRFEQSSSVTANIYNNEMLVGELKLVNPQIQKNFGIESTVSVVEINLASLLGSLNTEKNFTPISEYPDLKFDITVNSKKSVGELIEKIKEHHISIAEIKYLNSFQSKHSFQISLRSYTENLSKDIAQKLQEELKSNLERS